MADTKYLKLNNASSINGGISIAPDVVESIAGITVDQIDGVHLISNNFSKGFNNLLGIELSKYGAKLVDNDSNLVINVSIMVDFGVSVPKIAAKIQDRVKQQLLFMTGIVIKEVNVEVNGMLPDKTVSDVNPDDIFAEKNGEKN